MPNYRRAFVPGGTFFFTLVTFERQPFLTGEASRAILHAAIDACRERWTFDLDAIVLLPDHLHAIWTLPDGDADFSKRWAFIKRTFTTDFRRARSCVPSSDGCEAQKDRHAIACPTDAIRWQRRRSVWQPRFMEHTVRDERDYANHLNYLHFNPVKHGYAKCPHAWPWSSFERLVRQNVYEPDWCCACNGRKVTRPTFQPLVTLE